MKLFVSFLFLFLIGCTAQQSHDGQNLTEGEQNRRMAKSYLDASEADGTPVTSMDRPFPKVQEKPQPKQSPETEPQEEEPQEEEPQPKPEEESDEEKSDSSANEVPGEDF